MCLCVAWFDCRYYVAALVVQWAVAGQSLGKEFTAPRNPKSLLFAHDVDVMVRALLGDKSNEQRDEEYADRGHPWDGGVDRQKAVVNVCRHFAVDGGREDGGGWGEGGDHGFQRVEVERHHVVWMGGRLNPTSGGAGRGQPHLHDKQTAPALHHTSHTSRCAQLSWPRSCGWFRCGMLQF